MVPLESFLHRLLKRTTRLIPPADFRRIQGRLRGRQGIELGGPSNVFERWNLWPVYPVVRSLDNLNFAERTLWTDGNDTSRAVRLAEPAGRSLVGEAGDLADIAASAYDFLLASHVLEHLANPLKALHAWTRVVKPAGTILIIVPHRDGTFDHRRPVTPLEHIVDDFRNRVTERDETHFPEVLELHDLQRDPEAGSAAQFAERVRQNFQHRAVHHHVFTTDLALRLLDTAGFRIEYLDLQLPYHICIACSTAAAAEAGDRGPANDAWWSADAHWRRTSPFRSDRMHSTHA